MNDTAQSVAYPVLPLKNSILFPQMFMPLVVGRGPSIAAVDAALDSEDKTLVILAQKDPTAEDPALADLYPIGTLAVIKRMERGPDRLHIIVQGMHRVEVIAAEQDAPFLKVQVRLVPDPDDAGTEVEALHEEIRGLARQIHELLQPQAQLAIGEILGQNVDPLHQVYMLASIRGLDLEKERALLAVSTRLEALQLMHQ